VELLLYAFYKLVHQWPEFLNDDEVRLKDFRSRFVSSKVLLTFSVIFIPLGMISNSVAFRQWWKVLFWSVTEKHYLRKQERRETTENESYKVAKRTIFIKWPYDD